MVRIAFDTAKRDANLAKHRIHFRDALHVFAGGTFDFEDVRQDYPEPRIISIGYLAGRMVMIVWTERGMTRRIISMRKCNDREQKIYAAKIPAHPG